MAGGLGQGSWTSINPLGQGSALGIGLWPSSRGPGFEFCCILERHPNNLNPLSLPPTGIIGSAYSVSLNPADSTLEAVARVGRYTFTAAAIGAMFGLTTCVSAQVREKPDDPLNYFIGGCAGGLTLGARSEWPFPGDSM